MAWDYPVPAYSSLDAESGWWSKTPEKFHQAVKYGLEHAWYGSPYPAAVSAVNEALFQSENTAGSSVVPARLSVQESENWKNQMGLENAAIYLASLEGRRLLNQANPYSLGSARDGWLRILGEALIGGDPIPLLAELQEKPTSSPPAWRVLQITKRAIAPKKTRRSRPAWSRWT